MRQIDADVLWMEFNNASWYRNVDQYEIALPLIDAAHTIDPDSLRPKGEWVSVEAKPHLIYECSLCKSKWSYGAMLHMNFCPNCGADMRGEGDG